MTAVRLSLLSLAVVTLTGAGCAEVPPSTLYVLKAADPVVTDVARPANVVPLMVVLGPVTVPDYLDRTDIVRRASDNRLATADRERWGEPLRAGLQRVLAADLARGLGAAFWVATGADRAAQADIEVPVDLESFEPDATGRMVLTASWEVRWSHGEHQPVRERVRQWAVAPVTGTEDQVRTMSDQVAELAATLAATIRAPLASASVASQSKPSRYPKDRR